ncbi:MAG: hypothetical protein OER56_10520 [Hyphomicrobiales bacterium]|nr:hypothetical protein [Hyphomicrobiales bacterium]
MTELTANWQRQMFWTGITATIGAFIVGIGEFTFQYSPRGGYEGHGYLYFLDVSRFRLSVGHFLGVLTAPVYLIGYWHIAQMLRPAGRLLSAWVFGLGVYAFAIGNVWLGGRINLALTVKAREEVGEPLKPVLDDLLQNISAHNEPLINIVRVLILVVSLLMAWGIMTGRSHYPRWILSVLPIVVLVVVFASYAIIPPLGGVLLPAAMNIAHVVFFTASTWAVTCMRSSAY